MKPIVGIVRDKGFLEHKTGPVHPEHPNRLVSVYRMLDREFTHGLVPLVPELAPLEYLELVHTPLYIEKVLKTADHPFTSLAPSTPVSSRTYMAASLSVGACLTGLDALVEKACHFCFSLGRPPGHHALADRAAGFCIFNNLGITARYAMKRYHFQRILIVDWDVHHGNGIQDLFYGQSNVLYVSTHDILLYPYSGNWDETGVGDGKGYTVNLPIPREMTDEDFICLYKELLENLMHGFQPDLILVSAGFDAHRDDPITRSQLTENAFGGVAQVLRDLLETYGQIPVLLALEGGYNPKALVKCIKEMLEVLTGQKTIGYPEKLTPNCLRLLRKVASIHRRNGGWLTQDLWN